jgi:hypothetical protein
MCNSQTLSVKKYPEKWATYFLKLPKVTKSPNWQKIPVWSPWLGPFLQTSQTGKNVWAGIFFS